MSQDLDETNQANERLGRKLAETLAENERLTRELAEAKKLLTQTMSECENNGRMAYEYRKQRDAIEAQNYRICRELANAIRERDNALSDYRQADTDSIRALHERSEAREDRDSAHKEAERFRNVIQDCKWPKHAFSWENQTQTQ
jgi:septal ring factor EnvC (AmiA/AmiB activator)